MADTQSIDLLPDYSEVEKQEFKKKGKLNLTGVVLGLIVAVFSVAVIAGNFLTQRKYQNLQKDLVDTESEISSLEYVELKQRTLNNKVKMFSAARNTDFVADKVFDYMMGVLEDLADINSLGFDSSMNFAVSGSASSYSNVSRLWHDMCREEDFFEAVSLEYARESTKDGVTSVGFGFTGSIEKGNLADL